MGGFFSSVVWLSHLFVLRLLSHKLVACAAYTQFPLFLSVLTFCPPSSPPPLLTLVFSPAVSSVPGTAAPRYSPTKTHMHFQTDEEEEEEVKKRVCEPGRPPQPSSSWPAPARRALRLLTWCRSCLLLLLPSVLEIGFGIARAFITFSTFEEKPFFFQTVFKAFLESFSETGICTLVCLRAASAAGAAPDRSATKTAALFQIFPLFFFGFFGGGLNKFRLSHLMWISWERWVKYI